MSKEKKSLSDEMLDDVNGGVVINIGEKWSFDIGCPFCGKDDMLHQSLQLYSDQSGMTVISCGHCQRAFCLNSKGEISEVEYRVVG